MIRESLPAAVRHAQKLANAHGMRYSVTPAGSAWRIRLGEAPAGHVATVTVNPRSSR